MPAHLHSAALHVLLKLRAATLVPLEAGMRQAGAAVSSGARRRERLADAAWWSGDGLAALEEWRALERQQPNRPTWPVKIAQALKEGGDLDAAERVLLEARGRGIESPSLENNILRFARLCGRSNSAVDDAETIIADPSSPNDTRFYAAFYLMSRNRFETARTGFQQILDDPRYGPLARGHLAALDLLEQRRAQGRADIPGAISAVQTSIVVREPSSDTLVVGFVLPEGTLGLSINAVHAMLSPAGVNALYLYDSRQLFHLAGSDRFGPGWQAMLTGIRAMAAEMGVRRLITVGGSGTGYTAIRAALDLEADGALAFSPGTLMRPQANPALSRGAYTLQRLKRDVRPMMQDLRPLLRAQGPRPRIEIYYGASNVRDLMHVGNVSDAPGVVLRPVKDLRRHDCLTEMAARGYRDLLGGFAAAAPGVS